MTRNKKIAVGLLVIPLGILPLVLVLYAVSSFVGYSLGADATAIRFLNSILSILGVVGVISFPVCLFFGIKLIRKDAALLAPSLQGVAGYQGLAIEQIAYTQGWSWGACWGSLVWALGNKLYWWALGMLVPIWNIYVWIKLSVDGRKLAWEKGGWQGFEQFKNRQKIMAWVILIIIILGVTSRRYSGVETRRSTRPIDGRGWSAPPNY